MSLLLLGLIWFMGFLDFGIHLERQQQRHAFKYIFKPSTFLVQFTLLQIWSHLFSFDFYLWEFNRLINLFGYWVHRFQAFFLAREDTQSLVVAQWDVIPHHISFLHQKSQMEELLKLKFDKWVQEIFQSSPLLFRSPAPENFLTAA